MSSVVEAIGQFSLKLLWTVNGLELKVGIPAEGIIFEGMHELFNHEVIIGISIIASFHKMDTMLMSTI